MSLTAKDLSYALKPEQQALYTDRMGITPLDANSYLLIQPNLQHLAGDSPVVGVSLPRTTDTLIGFQSVGQWADRFHNVRPTTILTPRVPLVPLRVEGSRESYFRSVLTLLPPVSKLSFDPKVNYADDIYIKLVGGPTMCGLRIPKDAQII